MDTLEFENVLRQAINGSHEDIEIILKLYAPLIDRQKWNRCKFLKQCFNCGGQKKSNVI